MKRLTWVKNIKQIVFGCLFLLIMAVLSQRYEAEAATGSITAGHQDTVSVYDMKSSNLKNLSVASSNKKVKVKKKTYTDNGVKHTAVLAWAPYSYGEDESATITIRYYDIQKKKTVSVKKQVQFLANYNGGYQSEYKLATNSSKVFTIRGSAKLNGVYSSIDRYESSMFAPYSGGADGEEICSITSNKSKKTFTVHTNGFGMSDCYVAAYFINGECTIYRFNVIASSQDDIVYARKLKLVKGKATVLYFHQIESGCLSVEMTKEGIVSTEITEDQDNKEVALTLKGLKEGKTEVNLIYNAKGRTLINQYIVQVVNQSPAEEEIHLTPKEVDHTYTCIYQLTDSSGNLIKANANTQFTEFIPDSPEVKISSDESYSYYIAFSTAGTYHIKVKLKDLEGKTVDEYELKFITDELRCIDAEEITFSSEADAKAFFCGGKYRSWSSGEYTIGFGDDDETISYWDGDPWLYKSGDSVPGNATYSIDIKQKKIIVKDYDVTLEIGYEVLSKNHVRLIINGKTWDFH
jgi:hypothetical protein